MLNLKIDSSVKSQAQAVILPDPVNPFHEVFLQLPEVRVITLKDESQKNVLVFKFTTKTGKSHEHVEWPIDFNTKDEDKKTSMLLSRIAHIYTTYTPLPDGGIGNVEMVENVDEESQLQNYTKFFNQIVADFTAVYEARIKSKAAWLLTTYTTRGDVSLPVVPDFLEIKKEGVKPSIRVDKRYHALVQPDTTRPASIPNGAAGGAAPGSFDIP